MAEEVRALTEREQTEYYNMAAQAFRASPERARRNREFTPADEVRGILVNGQVMAGLKIIDMPIWMGQGTVPNGAITGVASPPENRRRGYIERLLYGTLVELREKNVPIATLYPFYFPFYKRYGWEHVEDKYLYKVPIDRFPLNKGGGTWEPLSRSTDFDKDQPSSVSEEGLAQLTGVYNAWCVGRNGPFARDEKWWRRGKLQDRAEKRPDVYLWRDPAGKPAAYVIYSFEEIPNQWKRRLIVWELTALDAKALRASLAFLRNHDSQALEAHVVFPAGLPFLALISDPEFVTEVEAGFMLRFVDVAQALKAKRYPAGVEDSLRIGVVDSFCEWNNGTFSLAVQDGAGTAERSDASPGLRMDQKTLARLYTGYLTAETAASVGLLDVEDEPALKAAQRIFAGPLPYLPDHF